MPEMPEVETVVSYLKQQIQNKKIIKIDVFLPKLLKNINEYDLGIITNQKIINLRRKAKYILIDFENQKTLIVHLRMEGSFRLENLDNFTKNKHDHILFYLNNDKILVYSDSRQFGCFNLLNSSDVIKFPEIKKLALDPLNEKFNINYLKNQFKNRSMQLKAALLNQSMVSGLGNIYVNELCYLVKLHPETNIKSLTNIDYENLVQESKKLMKKAISYNGTTIHSFKFNGINFGQFQNFLLVHNQKDKPCKNCGEKIIKIRVAQRGTYLCSICQIKK